MAHGRNAVCPVRSGKPDTQLAGRAEFRRRIGKDWKRWLLVILPTPILASQLWLFVWSPVNGEGINVAMGYFLFPLAMMLVGRIWFK